MPSSKPIPCLFERKIVHKVWGGSALAARYGWRPEGDEPIGETWEVYDRPDASSVVRGGAVRLRDWMRDHREALLGAGVAPAYGERFPLIVKFVDAGRALSVQVHPDDAQAVAAEDGGKAEAWVVLDAGPEACVRRGLRAGVTRAALEGALAGDGVGELLETFAPAVGDVVHLPPGTVHALGPDVLVYEIQQNSDVTYRLYDWGRPRPLHVEDSMRVTRFGAEPTTTVAPTPIDGGGELLVRDPHFELTRWSVSESIVLETSGRFRLVTAVAGAGVATFDGGELRLVAGDTMLVPACVAEVRLRSENPLELLVVEPAEA